MQVIALETAGTGVTCNTVCPGWVLTPCKYMYTYKYENNIFKSIDVHVGMLGTKVNKKDHTINQHTAAN